MSNKWQWFGRAGHFIAADRCFFHLHTHVAGGKYCVSTVGEYFPKGFAQTEPEQIGLDRLFETMVFKVDKKGQTNGNNLDFQGYNTLESAQEGHVRFCEKWDAKGK